MPKPFQFTLGRLMLVVALAYLLVDCVGATPSTTSGFLNTILFGSATVGVLVGMLFNSAGWGTFVGYCAVPVFAGFMLWKSVDWMFSC